MEKLSGILVKADIRLFLAIAVAFCLPMQCAVLGEDRVASEGQALKILTEAQKSALEMLHSAKATGRYLLLRRSKEDGEWRPLTKAHVVVLFAGGKYHIDLDYEIDQLNAPRRKILYDGKIVLQSTFGDDILPLHARGEVCETTGKFANPTTAGFPWNPARLPSEVLDFATLAKAGLTERGQWAPKSKFLWAAAIACCLILGGLLVLIARRSQMVGGAGG